MVATVRLMDVKGSAVPQILHNVIRSSKRSLFTYRIYVKPMPASFNSLVASSESV